MTYSSEPPGRDVPATMGSCSYSIAAMKRVPKGSDGPSLEGWTGRARVEHHSISHVERQGADRKGREGFDARRAYLEGEWPGRDIPAGETRYGYCDQEREVRREKKRFVWGPLYGVDKVRRRPSLTGAATVRHAGRVSDRRYDIAGAVWRFR